MAKRFEFDSKTGPNANRKNGQTRRGVIQVYPWEWPTRTLMVLDIRGPEGACRGSAVLDKATAGKLGAALLIWAEGEETARKRGLVWGARPGFFQPETDPAVIQAGKGFVPRFVGDEPDEN